MMPQIFEMRDKMNCLEASIWSQTREGFQNYGYFGFTARPSGRASKGASGYNRKKRLDWGCFHYPIKSCRFDMGNIPAFL